MSTETEGRTCRGCGAAALYLTGFCRDCIDAARELARCPDCTSTVTIAIVDGGDAMQALVEHDETCPTWRRECESRSRGMTGRDQ